MLFIDTHTHIHEKTYPLDAEEVYQEALGVGVTKMICIGTDIESSQQAAKFADARAGVFISLGIHPHESKSNDVMELEKLITHPKVVAVGECGLDYYYNHSPRDVQIKALREQIELALTYGKPLSFHVRDAFDDFWPILDSYKGIRGVLHSFTDSQNNLEKAMERGLYIGVNGIATFTKIDKQKAMFKMIPLEKLLLETDAPFLTPVPHRGTINKPAYVMCIANHFAELHSLSFEEIAKATTSNATTLFSL